jgi:hypothetical protein
MWAQVILRPFTHIVFVHSGTSCGNSFTSNNYRSWQPDELRQFLLGLVTDELHWQLKYLKCSNVKNQFDNGFTSAPQDPGRERVSEPFDSLKSSSQMSKFIRGMNRTLAVNCTAILDYCNDARNTPAETASDEMVLSAVQALYEFSPIGSQQNHSD